MNQVLYGLLALQLILTFLSKHFFPTNEQFLTLVKGFEVSPLEGVLSFIIGYVVLQKTQNYTVRLAALFFLILSGSACALSLIPADLVFGPDNVYRQSVVYAPVMLMFVSALCLLYNLVVLVFKSVESLEPPISKSA